MTPAGTRDAPWILKTPPLSSEFEAFRDEALDLAALVIRVGKTELRYHLRCIDDLHTMLGAHGDWMPLAAADEAWARAADIPVGGWYGLKRGPRGRFAVYVPPVLETLGLADVEHNPRNNRMRAAG